MLLVSCLMLYGDIFLPIKRISTSPQEVSTLPGAQLVLYCIALWNNVRICISICICSSAQHLTLTCDHDLFC